MSRQAPSVSSSACSTARRKAPSPPAISPITRNPASPVAAEAEYALEAVVGPEFVTGSTRMKAGTAQKLMLNMLSTAVMIRLGRVEGNRMVNMQLTNDKLVARGTRMVAEASGLDETEARELLLRWGSVKRALEEIGK